uniref:Uncharacterized protein n=1 Tax=Trichobilharzia regenti TaxID=157069 RepID=A0AA85JNJ7_TRIRE|nr:unnamed protein product [Trichobilharzia regenti]
MNGTTVATYESLPTSFLDIDGCGSFHAISKCNGIRSPKDDGQRDFIGGDNMPNSATDSYFSKCSHIFDEEVEITDTEEVKTPRVSSPTLNELRKRLAAISPNCRSTHNPIILDGCGSNGHIPKTILSEVSSKACAYPIDRLYDECIPVKSRIRSLKSKLGDNIPRITSRSISSQNSLRLLERVSAYPLPGPILRQTYSSTGSLIANLTDLSMNRDAMLSIPLTSGLCVSQTHCDEKISPNSDKVNSQFVELSSVATGDPSNVSEKLTPNSTLPVLNNQEAVADANPEADTGFCGLPNDSYSVKLDGGVFPDSGSTLNIESCCGSHLTDKTHVRSKRPGNKKAAQHKSADGDNVSPRESNSFSENSTERTCEKAESRHHDLIKSNSSDESTSEVKHQSSMETTDMETNQGNSLSDYDNSELSTSAGVISTHSNPSHSLTGSCYFPVSYVDGESITADEDFTVVTNKRMRRKQQQQQSKLVSHKSSYPEQSINNRDSSSCLPKCSSTHSVSNIGAPHQTRTNRSGGSTFRQSVQRNRPYLNAPVRLQSYSAHTTRSANPRETVCRKSNDVNYGSSYIPNNPNSSKSIPNSHLRSEVHNQSSQKSVYSDPFPTSPPKNSQVVRKPTPDNATLSTNNRTLLSATKETISSSQYQILRDFLLSAWKSFPKHPTNPRL